MLPGGIAEDLCENGPVPVGACACAPLRRGTRGPLSASDAGSIAASPLARTKELLSKEPCRNNLLMKIATGWLQPTWQRRSREKGIDSAIAS
jgi:hypothetical protein